MAQQVVDPDDENAPFNISQMLGSNTGPYVASGDALNSAISAPLGDTSTKDSVTPEGSPIDTIASMGAGALGGNALARALADSVESGTLGSLAADDTGSLDMSKLKNIITGGADDVASAVVPSSQPKTGPNINALPTQVQARNVDFQDRIKQQLALRKLQALMGGK